MAENLAQPIDYKTCPLQRGTANDFLVLRNTDILLEDIATIRSSGAVKIIDPLDDAPHIELVAGRCTGSTCAWWDETRQMCGVLPK